MANRNYIPTYNKIAAKATKLIKEKIKYYDLIDTALLIETIFCTYDGNVLKVHCQDYFKYLDEGTEYIPAYNIMQDIIESSEFQKYISKAVEEDVFEYELKELKKQK